MKANFRLRTPCCAKIVIIDSDVGEIEKIIFKNQIESVAYVRSTELLLTPKLFFRALLVLPRLYFSNKNDEKIPADNVMKLFYRSVQLSRLYYLMPYTVMTTTDNSGLYQWLSYNYKSCKFFAIQNGNRTIAFDCLSTKKLYHQTLFCFGENEVQRYKKYKHQYNEMVVVGAYRASYFFPKFEKESVIYDICFPVEWSTSFRKRAAGEQAQYHERLFKKSMELLENYLSRYAEESRASIIIAGRDFDPITSEVEKSYYQSKFGGLGYFSANKKDSGNTYRCMLQSKLIISFCSTTSYEALGWGKKCLFVDYSGTDMFNEGVSPGPWLLKDAGYEDFKAHVNELLAMNDQDYDSELGSHKKYLMASARDNLATEKIRRYIEKSCLSMQDKRNN
ncbi:MAG: hypothetical protein K0U29_00940 [Gammaproteobacteria bacterium]|nr:hypothetical protein [Gammaproteobacteria bacterium]MCH9743472.1 hypothetical protein [Gammaproteobacteria bacterium]